MSDACACIGCSNCGTTGIGEKIQHLNRSAGSLYYRRKPIPVGSLFRKKTGVLETERFQAESQILIFNAPFIRQVEKLPFSATLGTSMIVTVAFFPALVLFGSVPYYLGIGSD